MAFFENKGYKVTSTFGYRIHPISGERKFHKGIDLVKAHKAPVESFTAGKVAFAGAVQEGTGLGNMGNVVAVIEPTTGYLHIYAHLDSVSVKSGEAVKAGTVIGKQGNTGQSSGSHVHYEIRKKSAPSFGWTVDESGVIDPAIYWAKPAPKPLVKPAPKPVTPIKSISKTYTVKAGDTFSEIASKNKLTVDALKKKNPKIKNINKLTPGDKINL